MSVEISSLILKKVCNDEKYARKVLPFLKPEYFEGHQKVAYKIILDYISKYNCLPSKSTLLIDFAGSDANVEANQNVFDILVESTVDEDVNETWLLENTEQFCKDRSVFLGIMKSIEIIDGKDKELGQGAIPDILQKALSVSFDRSVGHDYIEDAKKRFEFYHETEEKIAFDIEMLNKITKGGVVRKSLSCLMGGTGTGKSLGLCHLASCYLSQGYDVLYITLEMAEERIAERIDANLLDIELNDIETMTKSEFESGIAAIKKKSNGNLIIKEYPTASAHVGHFRALLNELELKKNFRPQIIIIDYLSICASSRIRGLGGSVNTYSFVKSIAEEVRGLAVEFNLPIWTAVQVNRTGFNNSDADITEIAESFGLAYTLDLFLALITSEQLDSLNQLMIKQLKNRYNDLNYHKRFVIGIDKPKMRWYDAEDSAQVDVAPEAYTGDATEINTDDWSFE